MIASTATVGMLATRGYRAIAYCGNPACHRFRDFAGIALDLPALPAAATIDQLARALACSSCDRRSAEISTASPRWLHKDELAEIFGFTRRAPAPEPAHAPAADPVQAAPAVEDSPPPNPLDDPLVKAALATFPGAEIVAIRQRFDGAANAVREGAS